MSNELSKVSKENADMRKALVQTEREMGRQLTTQEFKFKKKEMELELEYKDREYKLKAEQIKSSLFSRFIIYLQLTVVIFLVYYIFLKFS